MFLTQISQAFLLRAKGRKGRDVFTLAYTLAHETDRTLGTDVPFLTEHQPVDPINQATPKQIFSKPNTEAQVLSEELLDNDSPGG
jgi:hypothetical protein